MDLFMPAERVLYDRAYCLSDEAEKDYAFEVAEEHGVDVGEVLYSDELMKEVRDALDRDIDLYLDDEIANFDSMLRELKCGDDPEHPAEISVVAMGSVGRWDVPSRGLVAANSLRDLIDGKGSADALVDCQIDRIVDTNGTFSIEASHHDGTAYLDVRLISGVSFDGKGFRLGGERYAPGKMDLDDFHILLGNLYDVSDVGPCSLPHFAERAYGAAQESYRFGETVFDIYCETSGTDKPYKVMVSAGETVGKDAGTRFASAEEAKAWCYRYSMRELADEVSSLSAILLDEEYYRLLVENRASASGVAVLSVEGLIPFKAKAWLDLSARRAGGQAVDEKSVEKHRNDVCRLATLLAGGERPAMSEGVRADMRRFLEAYESDPVDPKALKIKGVGAQQVVEVLKSVYLR